MIGELGDAQLGQARLARSEVLARTSHLEVGLGQLESVRRLHHQFQPLTTLVQFSFRDQVTDRCHVAATHTSAQLVQLRQAEPIRALNRHHGRPGQIDADLDHDRRDQHIGVTVGQVGHHRLLLLRRHPPMQQPDPRRQFTQRPVAQSLELLRRGFGFELVRLLDQWADDERLSTQLRFFADAPVDDLLAVRWRHDLRLHT